MSTTDNIAEFLRKGVQERVFSGAQAAWCLSDTLEPRTVCAGFLSDETAEEIGRDTLFDIASVTKIFSASAVLRLVDKGVLDLDAPLAQYLPEFKNTFAASANLAQLLAHEAGFAAWLPFFESIPISSRGTEEARSAIVKSALEASPDSKPGTRALYSDLGFIILPSLVEAVLGESFTAVVEREVTEPLYLKSARFLPLLSGDNKNKRWAGITSSARVQPAARVTLEANGMSIRKLNPAPTTFAGTERCPWRGKSLAGEVHDDNAWAMGGVSGHAGMFAAAKDVAKLGAAWLRALNSGRWISKNLATMAVARRSLGRGLGWDLKDASQSSAGIRMGPRSFGHLGFTGCSLWVDPDAGISVALNTNRVIFGRDNLKIRDFRPRFHDLIFDECLGSTSR